MNYSNQMEQAEFPAILLSSVCLVMLVHLYLNLSVL